MLEPELELTVGEPLEPFLSDGRTGHVATQALELSPVAAVDRLLGVDVDASVLGDGLVRVLLGSFGGGAGAEDEPELGLPRALAAHADSLRCGRVAGGEPRLVGKERWHGLVAIEFEAPAVSPHEPR